MARVNAAAADANADAVAATPDAPASEGTPAPASEPKTTGTVMVQMPIKLKELIEAKAEAAEMNTAAFIRTELAKMVDYVLPLPTPRGRKSKYAGMSPDEAKAAKKADNETRQAQIKALFKAAAAGELDLNAILAKYAADTAAAKPAADAPAAEEAVAATA